jgi:hypothetical protein
MEDRESGNLSRKPALDLLVELHQGAVTGSLKLERAPLQKAVYFRDGQILFAASNDPKDQLASILVEEGKLGPDQMQVAQARVTPGNPLAKVLTELGYISQRELADAARIKVEKILTDLYTWKEGVYQFATKSLPKGAIDLELSTPRLLFASIRRVQDREWVLRQLGSLESVLTPSPALDSFLRATEPEPLAEQVLKLADGVRTVKQIGAMSSLGEFEVCKVLAAALVGGALSRNDVAAVPAANVEAFSIPSEAESYSFPPPPTPTYGSAAADVPSEVSPEPSYDTVYQAAAVRPPPPVEESERTVFEPAPMRSSEPSPPPVPPIEPMAEGASELLIDEPEPASESPVRNPPRPKGRRGGRGGSGSSAGILKWIAAAALLAAVGFAAYSFLWPLVASRPKPTTSAGALTTTTAAPVSGSSSATAEAATTIPPTSSPTPPVSATPTTAPAAATTSVAPRSTGTTSAAAPASTTIPRDPAPTRPSGAAKPPPPTPPKPTGGDGRSLLASGNLPAAARAFESELSSTAADKFTLALGLYCNEENVERLVSNAQGSRDIYVLPTTSQGRACYRVTWGLYGSREAAEAARGSLPGTLRSGDVAPVPLSRFVR